MKNINELTENTLYWLKTYEDDQVTVAGKFNWIPATYDGKDLVGRTAGLIWNDWLNYPEDIVSDYEFSNIK